MKKILYVNTWMHPKNHNSIKSYKNITLYEINNVALIDTFDLSMFDCVYSPSSPINVEKYPNTKFLFGPHFSVFPEKKQMDIIRRNNVIYTQPSEWAAKTWRDYDLCENIRVEPLPFGVDTERFKNTSSDEEKDCVFIYFKSRHPNLLNIMKTFLMSNGIKKCVIFNYDTKYEENTYIEYLKKSKYGIWIGRHESQGFALQEALSMGVPLLVWNVMSMNEEYGCNYADIPATVIPYWDERCGEYFTNLQDLPNAFNLLISKIDTYKPREYVLEKLSMDVCEKRLIELIDN
jgi:glycosyltransferase involved in cell wall biosynthesis